MERISRRLCQAGELVQTPVVGEELKVQDLALSPDPLGHGQSAPREGAVELDLQAIQLDADAPVLPQQATTAFREPAIEVLELLAASFGIGASQACPMVAIGSWHGTD